QPRGMSIRPTPWMRKPGRALLEALLWLGATGLVAGCPASAEQVAPPQFDLYFPTGLATSPDQKYLFAISANSDLLYSAGSVLVFDLDAVASIAGNWQTGKVVPAGCEDIATRPTILSCPTNVDGQPANGILGDAGMQIGSFGISLAVEPL